LTKLVKKVKPHKFKHKKYESENRLRSNSIKII